MDIAERCVRISNSYYNLGLSAARERNLSAAVPNLKRALEFNKNQMDARNLLGLIYFEMGEVGDAIVQWVISLNLQPYGNRADVYLDEIQRKPGKLEAYSRVISRYNQALAGAQNDNWDLAVLQLNRITESSPGYVRANLLLALLLMRKDEHQRALKYLNRVLQTDRGNEKALWYLSVAKAAANAENARRKNGRSEKKPEPVPSDDVIIPSGYHENTGWQTVMNIVMGILIGAASILFLYMPTKTAQLSAAHNQDLIVVDNQLSDANNQIRSLTDENTTLTSKTGDLTNQLNTIEESNTYRLSQYQKLIGILDDYRNQNYSHAADLFATIDASQFIETDDGSGVSVSQIYNSISGKMKEEGYISLAAQGDAAYEAANYEGAIGFYDKALAINPDYEQAMFKKAMSYKQMGDLQNANNLFGEVIIRFPGTEQAAQARNERGY